jgi:hypothetical protein
VYLLIVFLVAVVLWGVMPWIISGYGDSCQFSRATHRMYTPAILPFVDLPPLPSTAELNLEDRILALETSGPGTGGVTLASHCAAPFSPMRCSHRVVASPRRLSRSSRSSRPT